LKALSLKQPFAELIVTGKKTIELRKWKTNFRGEFLVHASKVPFLYEKLDGLTSLPLGAIVGTANLVGVKKYESLDEWNSDQKKHLAGADFHSSIYGFILEDAIKFEKPIPCKGALNFFEVGDEIVHKNI